MIQLYLELLMITYEKLVKKPAHFHRITGLHLDEFDDLYDKFTGIWNNHIFKRSPPQTRKRDYGGGRHAHIETLKDKLVFILVYTRIYPLLFIQGIMFNLSESKACEWVHRLLPLLDEALGFIHQRPKRGGGKSLEQVLEEFPELKEMGILGDGVERPSRRPKDSEKQKANYSGKKKRHARKNIVLSNPKTNRVLYPGKAQDGSVHDKKCLDEESLRCRDPVPPGLDLGFEGYEKDCPVFFTNNLKHKKQDRKKDLAARTPPAKSTRSSCRILKN